MGSDLLRVFKGGERLLQFLKRHPSPAVAAGGLYLAAPEIKRQAKTVENQIMANQLGSPYGKYVLASLDTFEEKKANLDNRLAFVKKAEQYGSPLDALGGGLFSGFGKETAKAGVQGIVGLLRGAGRKLQNTLFLDNRRHKLVENIIDNDPIISVFERENPGQSYNAYSTMASVAPTLSLDPNVVTSFLREAAQTGGPLNHLTVKQLAEAEHAVGKAQGYF